MSKTFITPTISTVHSILTLLFPHTSVESVSKQSLEPAYLATYADESDHLVAVCACDIEFAANVSSALSMKQPAMAHEAIQAGKLDSELHYNLYEIMGLYTELLTDKSSPKIHLRNLYQENEIPENVSEFLNVNDASIFCADLPIYGSGIFEFTIA